MYRSSEAVVWLKRYYTVPYSTIISQWCIVSNIKMINIAKKGGTLSKSRQSLKEKQV